MNAKKKMIRALIVYAVYIILLSQLQVTLPDWFSFFGSKPDLTLVLVILSGYLFGRVDGALVGLAAGFMRDMFAGRALGLGMLLFLYIGILAALVFQQAFRRNLLLGLLQVIWLTILYEVVVTGVVFMMPMLPDVTYDASTLYQRTFAQLPTQLAANVFIALPLSLLLIWVGPYHKKNELEDEDD